jgi:hypothetical protein
MIPRTIALSAIMMAASSALAQSPHDWHYHELPHGPSAPGVHRVLGQHKQGVPFYTPMQSPESFGPRAHLRYGWFGRYSPSPRPAVKTAQVQSPGGS